MEKARAAARSHERVHLEHLLDQPCPRLPAYRLYRSGPRARRRGLCLRLGRRPGELRTCARQAQRALVAFGYEESESEESKSADDSNAEEFADDEVVVIDDESDADHGEGHHEHEDEREVVVPHPPPPPPSPIRRDLISARTRGALARARQMSVELGSVAKGGISRRLRGA